MMTLEEAIIHCEDVAEGKRKQVENGDWENGSLTECDCIECAEEHRQLAEWLKELKTYRQMDTPRVMCATCRHIDIRNVQGQAAPVCFCRSKIWDGLHKAPHLIGHDPYLPIMCDYWEAREEGQNNGNI